MKAEGGTDPECPPLTDLSGPHIGEFRVYSRETARLHLSSLPQALRSQLSVHGRVGLAADLA